MLGLQACTTCQVTESGQPNPPKEHFFLPLLLTHFCVVTMINYHCEKDGLSGLSPHFLEMTPFVLWSTEKGHWGRGQDKAEAMSEEREIGNDLQ